MTSVLTASDVERALTAPGPAWMPGLAGPLAAARRDALARETGLSASAYGTARMLAGDPAAERDGAAGMQLAAAFGATAPVVVETLRPATARQYLDLGLVLADGPGAAAAVPRLAVALDRLATVPEVALAFGALVSTIHVAIPEGPDYDVSFSDPRLPFSVFVGVGEEAGPRAGLRLAEGLLHECMHLQLTLAEAWTPLVSGSDDRHHSPWQGTMRPAQGILHGVYVFAAIRDFMAEILAKGEVRPDEEPYVRGRLRACSAEIREAAGPLLDGRGLTDLGRSFVLRLL